FYRMPKTSVLESWNEQVGESFRFSIKASRRITHFKRLKEAGDETAYLLEATQTLGDRLGVVLFQLPPNLRLDLPRLEAFLELLPKGTRAAFEFRHESWFDETVFDSLRSRNFALVGVDADDEALEEITSTADWGYLRLRRADYERADLASWAARVRAQNWERAFVFFKHEDDGAGPRMAGEFLEVAERAAERKPAARGGRKSKSEEREAG
ncbi:MAG: DUF72 domain-containing protein, partial [Planctomycetota bacterium]